ncbi:MAG TPA: nucleoside-diphosphate kinase [Sphaerochaeta sp.]|nr:nucleoside-diphosphate kinase [Sphaerochaeta sp.]
MPTSLSYLLVTPHALRTGQFSAPLAPIFSADSVHLAGAQVISLTEAFIDDYSALLQKHSDLAASIECLKSEFALGSTNALLLFFSGSDAATAIHAALPPAWDPTLGIVALDADEAAKALALFYRHYKDSAAVESTEGADLERSLILLKPDNWRTPSVQPALILQLLASSGVSLIAAKVLQMSVEDALDFYGPIKAPLTNRLAPRFGSQAKAVLEEHFGFSLDDEIEASLTEGVGSLAAEREFHEIIAYMSGNSPDTIPPERYAEPGSAMTLALLYEGAEAVAKLRRVIGATNPAKAAPGTVRKTFGNNILENTIHGSDSPESTERESAIVGIRESTIARLLADR